MPPRLALFIAALAALSSLPVATAQMPVSNVEMELTGVGDVNNILEPGAATTFSFDLTVSCDGLLLVPGPLTLVHVIEVNGTALNATIVDAPTEAGLSPTDCASGGDSWSGQVNVSVAYLAERPGLRRDGLKLTSSLQDADVAANHSWHVQLAAVGGLDVVAPQASIAAPLAAEKVAFPIELTAWGNARLLVSALQVDRLEYGVLEPTLWDLGLQSAENQSTEVWLTYVPDNEVRTEVFKVDVVGTFVGSGTGHLAASLGPPFSSAPQPFDFTERLTLEVVPLAEVTNPADDAVEAPAVPLALLLVVALLLLRRRPIS